MSIETGDESGHPPKVQRVSYSGRALRFLELPERELLLNTKDVCALAGILGSLRATLAQSGLP